MKIAVVGIGYVGLSNAIVLAQHNEVIAFDIDKIKVDSLNKRKILIHDAEMADFLKKENLSLNATLDKKIAIQDADYVIIATPTNYDSETNMFDTTSVENVIKDVKTINKNAWIVIKSTVGVGYTENIINKLHFDHILFSPEFLREGKALHDNLFPSRIIVGVPQKNKIYLEKAREFAQLLLNGTKDKAANIFVIGSTEAEAVKLFSNAYLALRVSYFNELDTFAKTKALNAKEIIDGVCADPRIGDYYNNPSFGYGGYCLPKDTKELKNNFGNIPQTLISACIESNATRKKFIIDEIIKLVKPGDTIGIYRLMMKSNGDNFRDSSIIDILLGLKVAGFNVIIFEPQVTNKNIFDSAVLNDFDEFVKASNIIVANRKDEKLSSINKPIYSADIFNRD